MFIKTLICSLLFFLALSQSGTAAGATLYVDGSVAESGDGTSAKTALKKIQEGIDKAPDGDTVIVAEGTYLENIVCRSR